MNGLFWHGRAIFFRLLAYLYDTCSLEYEIFKPRDYRREYIARVESRLLFREADFNAKYTHPLYIPVINKLECKKSLGLSG